MKYTTVVMLIVSVCSTVLLAERTEAQTMHETKIMIHAKDLPIADILEQIEVQSKFRFVYNAEQLHTDRRVSITIESISVSEALQRLFDDRSIHVQQQGRTIVLMPEQAASGDTTGSIKGVITDSQTGETLPGASVVLQGTTQGSLTDGKGRFVLQKVPTGTYTLVASFLGYTTKKLEHVEVTAGNETVLTISLASGASDLQEVVVEAGVDVRYTPIQVTTEESLLSDIRLSNNIVTGISNVQITRSLDRDAADVMKRVPGVSTLNNFVLVRGLDPRYNVTYLNGMLMPSTESDSRAFAFNLIPSGLIDGIKIYKLPAPELPGGFGGGVIKVSTPRNQVARRFEVNVSSQYRTGGSSLADHYTGSNNSSKDVWAMGANDRKLPSQFYDKYYELPRGDFYPEDRMAEVRMVPKPNDLVKERSGLDRRFSVNYHDSYRLAGVRWNNLFSAGYSYQRSFNSNHIVQGWTKLDSVPSAEGGGKMIPSISFEAIDSTYAEDVRISLLESMGLIFNDNHRIDVNIFANRSAANNTNVESASNMTTYSINLDANRPAPVRSVAFEYQARDLFSGQVSGEHSFGERHHVEWRVGRSSMHELIPDFQMFKYNNLDYQSDKYNVVTDNSMNGNIPRQYYNTREHSTNAGFDYAFTVHPFLTLKAGTQAQLSTRDFENMVYTTITPPNGGSAEFQKVYRKLYKPWTKNSEIFSDANFKDDLTGWNMIKAFSALSYSYEQNITAGYVATLWKLLDNKLEVYGGVRYENEYAQLYDDKGEAVRGTTRSETVINPETGNPETQVVFHKFKYGPVYNYYLPSVNVTWNITAEQKLRAGYGRTLDRPAFRERSTARFYNTRDGSNYLGNVQLTNATLDNVDLRWEWYPSESEFISAGTFYKFIDKPIEIVESGTAESRLYKTWYNKAWAELYGVELEIRKNLSFIPIRYAERFSIIANASFVHTLVRDVYTLETGETMSLRSKRPLTGSSPYLYNITLYYEAPRSKAVFTITYNEIGGRIITSSPSWAGNLQEKPQRQMDLIVLYPIGKYLKMKAGVQNLLNQDVVRWRDGNYDGKYTPGKFKPNSVMPDQSDHEGERWNPGAYYSLGLTATF